MNFRMHPRQQALKDRRDAYTYLVTSGLFYAGAFIVYMLSIGGGLTVAVVTIMAISLSFKGAKMLSTTPNRFSRKGFCPACQHECHSGGANEPCAECGEPLNETGVMHTCCHLTDFDNAMVMSASVVACLAMLTLAVLFYQSLP